MLGKDEKTARLAAALRANLRKRKSQVRAADEAADAQRQGMNVAIAAAADPAE